MTTPDAVVKCPLCNGDRVLLGSNGERQPCDRCPSSSGLVPAPEFRIPPRRTSATASPVVDMVGLPIEPGARVWLMLETRDGWRRELAGIVRCLEGAWVHWRDDDGADQASPGNALKVVSHEVRAPR